MKIPAQYKHRVKDVYRDEDGYWIILAASWKCPDGYAGERTIHEDTAKEALAVLRETRFALN